MKTLIVIGCIFLPLAIVFVVLWIISKAYNQATSQENENEKNEFPNPK